MTTASSMMKNSNLDTDASASSMSLSVPGQQCRLGGVRFDNVTMAEAVSSIVRMAQKTERARLVCTANLDHLASLSRDDEFARIYASADFVVADGMPLVWLSKLAGTPLKERVAGSSLLWELARASASAGVRLFFLGGAPGSAEAAAHRLRELFPGTQVAGWHCPPVGTLGTVDEEAKIASAIAAAQPDILLVGLGSPKQEKWIAARKDALGVPVSIGVGAAFDMAAGRVRRAPVWMQRSGLEWVYRLAQEPKRLAGRYIAKDVPFMVRLTMGIALQRLRSPRGEAGRS